MPNKLVCNISYWTPILFILLWVNNLYGQPILKVTETNPNPKIIALLFGISSYQNIENLNYAHKDVLQFSDFLKTQGKAYELHLHTFTNKEATRAAIYDALYSIGNQHNIQSGDRLVLYFSGHSKVDTFVNQGFLLAHDTPIDNYFNGGVNLNDLDGFIKAYAKKGIEVIVFLDACRTGKFVEKHINTSSIAYHYKDFSHNMSAIFLSCKPEEFSLESKKWGNGRGLFSFQVHKGLEGAADKDGNHFVTVKELERYLEDTVPIMAFPKKQNPFVRTMDKNKNLAVVYANNYLSEAIGQSYKKSSKQTITSDSTNLHQFKKAIEEKRLIEPEGNNAHYFFQKLNKDVNFKEITPTLQRELYVSLLENSQQLLNWLIANDITNVNKDSLANGIQEIAIALELLPQNHGLYQEWQSHFWLFQAVEKLIQPNVKAFLPVAVRNVDKAIEEDLSSPFVWAIKGFIHTQLQEWKDGEKAIDKALVLNPNFAKAHYYKAVLYYEWYRSSKSQDRLRIAQNSIQRALELRPDIPNGKYLETMILSIQPSSNYISKYWIETSDLDSLVIVSNGNQKTIKGFKNNTYFNIKRTTNQPFYLKPYCDKPGCKDSISIKLWGQQEDAYTSWIYLQSKDPISIDECFIQYTEANFLSRTYQNAKAVASAFWKSVKGGGRIISSQRAVLRGGEPPKSDESKVSFAESDNFRYQQITDFQVPFEVAYNYPIKSIYIISNEGELMFCSGDPSLVMEVFPTFKKEQAPNLSTVLTIQPLTDDYFKNYSIDIEKTTPYLLKEFQKGGWYQLGVELEDDSTDFNPYLFNFQFFTEQELQQMEAFAGVDLPSINIQSASLIEFITDLHDLHVKKSCKSSSAFSDVDFESFLANDIINQIIIELENDNDFLRLVEEIKKMPESERSALLKRAKNTYQPTWAEIGRISCKAQTDAGQAAQRRISSAIVSLVKNSLNFYSSLGINYTLSPYGKNYALFIAVKEYNDSTWSKLNNPIKDTKTLASLLNEKYQFDTTIYINSPKNEILSIIDDWQKKVFKDNDQLFVFFTGHGFVDQLTDIGYFIPKDGIKGDFGSFVNLVDLWGWINKIPCKHILLAIDACYSGIITEKINLKREEIKVKLTEEKDILRSMKRKKSRFILTSGNKERTPDGRNHSSFTTGLLDGLKNSYEREDSLLLFYELLGRLQRVAPRPHFGRLDTDANGQFIFNAKGVIDAIYSSPTYPEMIYISGGKFYLGSEKEATSQPIRQIDIDGFKMAETEITVKQYMTFANEVKAHYPEWNLRGTMYGIKPNTDVGYLKLEANLANPDSPIVGISWDDANAYCDWLSKKTGQTYRLPSEAEWEYAAGGGFYQKTNWAGLDDAQLLNEYSWYEENADSKPQSVRAKQSNMFGLYDMSGNVAEWCQDTWFNDHSGTHENGTARVSNHTKFKVIRGGYFKDNSNGISITHRVGKTRDIKTNFIGFRPVCNL